MKSILILASAAVASAGTTLGCAIPSRYVTSTGQSCTGVQTGYRVFGYCSTGLDRTVFTTENTMFNVYTELTATNLAAFSADPGDTDLAGCIVPSYSESWAAGGLTMAALSTTMPTACGALTAAGLDGSTSPIKGAAVRCNVDQGFFAIRGVEGSNFCADDASTVLAPARTVGTGDYFASPAAFDAIPPSTTLFDNMYSEFTGDNQLICSRGCQLDSALCNNGVFAPGIVGNFDGLVPTTGANACFLRPSTGVAAFPLSFACIGGGAAVFTLRCEQTTVGGTPTLTGTGLGYNGRCGPIDGALSPPFWNNGDLDFLANNQIVNQVAGDIANYPTVTSTLQRAYDANAYAAGFRAWYDTPAKAFVPGAVYIIRILGCVGAETARRQCVQQTLNWWRCKYDFPFEGGSLCFANGILIACPTHELGFRCPSSSKKGLLGLLGLLGLIPLFLCCCLLFLCCIRRRKTEADVHFATFDPHAAPVMATAPCATATACPTAFGATPFATHPSAMPCL